MKAPTMLFSASSPIGCGARGEPEFRTGADLLRHLDRLGIARTVVWSVQARDHHPATGNRWLLNELAAPGAARERLVPALVVAPSMQWEDRSVDELVEHLRDGVTRALWAFPATTRFRLHHLEPLLDRLLPFRPALFIPVTEVYDDRDLCALAQTFPQLPIVAMFGMWPQFFNYSLFDLLRRCPNLLVDTSWQHTAGTLERVVRDYGPERAVFAIGPAAHNGASIAHLQYAELDEAAREAVAHGNLERLLGLPPTLAATVPPAADSLWPAFREGQPLGVEILDAHAHLGTLGHWPLAARDIVDEVPLAVARMDAVGIHGMIVSGADALFSDPVAGNARLEREAAAGGDRIHGYFSFNPFYAQELTPQFDEFFARPFFVGFKTLGDYWGVPITDARFAPAYRYANLHRLPILFHTWQGPFDAPVLLRDLVREYPDVAFILGHSGGTDDGRRQAEDLAAANPNVYLEWCGSFCGQRRWEETLRRVDPRQVVFGTDGIYHDLAWELGRFVSLNVPAATLRPILGDNLRRVLARRR